eukprot:gene13975-14092_t
MNKTHKHNFGAGPCVLPLPVLEQAALAVKEWEPIGLSILEVSHRSKAFEDVILTAELLVRELLGVPVDYSRGAKPAAYLDTGYFSGKAIKEAGLFGRVDVIASSKKQNYTCVPKGFLLPENIAYFHYTSNNTIEDIFSREIDVSKFDLIYAGAQKNAGPAGLTIVIAKNSLIDSVKHPVPSMLDYRVYRDHKSMYNTPPVFAIYTTMLNLQWLKDKGGVPAIEIENRMKAQLLYNEIDSNHIFEGIAAIEDRSLMNVTFRTNDPVKEGEFLAYAAQSGMVGINGYRTVGGFRASLYNALPLESAQALISCMQGYSADPFYADQLVFTKPHAESVSGDAMRPGGLLPLKTLLESNARNRPETPKEASMFVYEVSSPGLQQSGIWALTDLYDPIKTHELTFHDSVRRISNYRLYTRLEGSPILLTYTPDPIIERVHKLWKIQAPEIVKQFTTAFERVNRVYLADGHHRKKSAELLLPLFDSISALYMSAVQLKIRQYNRVVIPDQPIDKDWIFRQLLPHFYIYESFKNGPVQPCNARKLGMFLKGNWYHLQAKPHTHKLCGGDSVPDVSILQDRVLSPVFRIDNPATDQRLKYAGGESAIAEMEGIFRAHPDAVGFTLCPMTAAQLFAAADAEVNLPPKSTWIDPKIPYGLLFFQHELPLSAPK